MAEEARRPHALEGLRVVELGEGVAPAFCGKWLAAFGAEVIKVEPPGGDPLRRYRLPGEPISTPEMGALFAYLNTGKQSIVLDEENASDRKRLRALLSSADIAVHALTPAMLTARGIDLTAIQRTQPGLVEVALPPFGSDGPYRDWAATSLVLLALGGYQFLTGEPGHEPLMLPGFQPEYQTGLYGVVCALAGLLDRGRRGRGASFTVTALEAVASLHQFTISLYYYAGIVRSRHGCRWENLYPITLLPCRDGWVGLAITTPDQWERLCAMMGRPDLVDDPRFATPSLRREHAEELDAILIPWLANQDRRDFFRRAQEEWRLPVGPLYTLDEVLAEPQYTARRFWVRPEGIADGPLHPGLPVAMSATPWAIRPAPRLGEGEVRRSRPAVPPFALDHRPADPALPLMGLRVLDFTRVWAGPLSTRILADLGAEVIRVEAPQTAPAATNPQLRPVDRLPTLAAVGGLAASKLNRNKQSIVVDLRRPAGQELVRRLATRCDVLVENFSARVMPQFGLDYASLRPLNPGLVMLSMPGFGTGGPYQNYLAYGPAIEPMTGLTSLIGYPDGGPLPSAIAYPDAIAGVTAAAALLVALVHRARTGEGQFIDLSQLEATTCVIGEYLLAYQMGGMLPERAGNAHPAWSPHGTYRCRGEDEWVSIAVRNDTEWQRFCAVAGLEALAADPALADADGRRHHRARLDAAIAAWTRGQEKRAVMERLQRAGVPAGAVLTARDMLEDPQLLHGGFFVQARGGEGATYLMPGTPIRVDGTCRQEWHAAPRHGEHTRTVLRDILGMSDAEIDHLHRDGVIGDSTAATQRAG